jgi:hypothetical protein
MVVRILPPQPASAVSATSFPRVGEVPTFPRVTLSQRVSEVENGLSSSGFRRIFGALSQLALFQFPFPRGRDRFETARDQFA